MSEPKRFTDLLDDYLFYKAAWDECRTAAPQYNPRGPDLYDSMDRAKQALDDFVAAASLNKEKQG